MSAEDVLQHTHVKMHNLLQVVNTCEQCCAAPHELNNVVRQNCWKSEKKVFFLGDIASKCKVPTAVVPGDHIIPIKVKNKPLK